MDNKLPDNKPNGNKNNNNQNGKNPRNGQTMLIFVLVSLVLLFVLTLVNNKFTQLNTKEISYFLKENSTFAS